MAELGLGENLWNQAFFQSHQAVEKSLKALFDYEGGLPPRTHRLTNLSKSLENGYPSPKESADDLLVLKNFYIPSRYPDATPASLPQDLPGSEDAERVLAAARKVSEFVERTVRSTG